MLQNVVAFFVSAIHMQSSLKNAIKKSEGWPAPQLSNTVLSWEKKKEYIFLPKNKNPINITRRMHEK